MRFRKTVLTFDKHSWSIAPNTHLPIAAQFDKDTFKSCYSLGVVFKEKQCFHLEKIYFKFSLIVSAI